MDGEFLTRWGEAAMTSLGFFWMALWAFVLGYVISSMIQVFVTEERMQRAMGGADGRSVALATFFGFVSSSCSFAALATTKSLLRKGAGFVPSLAFLLASTNLVIELGFIISVFLTWQFVVGEYVGGVLLILIVWALVRITRPESLVSSVRERLGESGGAEEELPDWRERIATEKGWRKVARHYFMEWGMVWKDVTVGFTVAGVIAAFVPRSFFETLFLGTGAGADEPGVLLLLQHAAVGPLAAFCTFIGSMGNIPLASLLYANGVSFAGIMAFIFSDLVVFPVLRINAAYYGWKMSLYIAFLLFTGLVVTSLLLHLAMDVTGVLPRGDVTPASGQSRFAIDHTFFLNVAFLLVTAALAWLAFVRDRGDDGHGDGHEHDHGGPDKGWVEPLLRVLAVASYLWLAGGVAAHFLS